MDWEPEQAIARALNIGWWDWELGADRCAGNEVLADLFGLDQDEVRAGVSAMKFVDVVHPEDRGQVYGVLSRSIVYSAGYDVAYRVGDADDVRWLRAVGRCFQQSGKKRHVGVAIDISGLIAGDDPDQREKVAFAAQHSSTAQFLMSSAGFQDAFLAAQNATREIKAALARLDTTRHDDLGKP